MLTFYTPACIWFDARTTGSCYRLGNRWRPNPAIGQRTPRSEEFRCNKSTPFLSVQRHEEQADTESEPTSPVPGKQPGINWQRPLGRLGMGDYQTCGERDDCGGHKPLHAITRPESPICSGCDRAQPDAQFRATTTPTNARDVLFCLKCATLKPVRRNHAAASAGSRTSRKAALSPPSSFGQSSLAFGACIAATARQTEDSVF